MHVFWKSILLAFSDLWHSCARAAAYNFEAPACVYFEIRNLLRWLASLARHARVFELSRESAESHRGGGASTHKNAG